MYQTTPTENQNGEEIRHSDPVYYKSFCNGKVLFRSKLEARWALFFDLIREPWLYEPKSFILENGMVYVPDFYLMNIGWVEIKPSRSLLAESAEKIKSFIISDRRKCDKFPMSSILILLTPTPNFSDSMLLVRSKDYALRGSGIGYNILCKREFMRQMFFSDKIEWMIAIDHLLDYVSKYKFDERGWRMPEFPTIQDLRN